MQKVRNFGTMYHGISLPLHHQNHRQAHKRMHKVKWEGKDKKKKRNIANVETNNFSEEGRATETC